MQHQLILDRTFSDKAIKLGLCVCKTFELLVLLIAALCIFDHQAVVAVVFTNVGSASSSNYGQWSCKLIWRWLISCFRRSDSNFTSSSPGIFLHNSLLQTCLSGMSRKRVPRPKRVNSVPPLMMECLVHFGYRICRVASSSMRF